MIEIELLTQAHLDAFEPETPVTIPEGHLGLAAVGVEDGKPLAVCLVVEKDGVAEIGLVMSAAARKYPVSLHRLARQMLAGLHMEGYQRITTGNENVVSVAWLERLGFRPVEGGFEKCQ